MIAHLRGTVAHRDAETVVVDVHGVGYLVHVADPSGVPPVGQSVELHTSQQVREDALDLYGFTSRAGLATFELVMRATGVGPRLGLATLRTLSPDAVRTALATGDVATLTSVPGIGKKVAERLVLELRDKVGSVADLSGAGESPRAARDATTEQQAREALRQLGYREGEITHALADAPADAGVEDLVRHALRSAGARA
ncbi:Holliday junction branch migration protein RuvA [Salsipaludibacter albus]|uniref:Holliday junction branch migration protein RuvA n=1 Tax=Salsipaludibacter albus TaxID=2849650 RepID=UPI001EE3E6A7|nr:Holliday junction branch migration protein RuvA [Salsipaludibacter albus]MBY5163961.1 Holliday junction branch migration protein RuvA [Salsipaludibacter albus]